MATDLNIFSLFILTITLVNMCMHTCINLTIMCMFALLFYESIYAYYVVVLTMSLLHFGVVNKLLFFMSSRMEEILKEILKCTPGP